MTSNYTAWLLDRGQTVLISRDDPWGTVSVSSGTTKMYVEKGKGSLGSMVASGRLVPANRLDIMVTSGFELDKLTERADAALKVNPGKPEILWSTGTCIAYLVEFVEGQ